MSYYYIYEKELRHTGAFAEFLTSHFGSDFFAVDGVPPFDRPLVKLVFNRELTEAEIAQLTTLVTNYVSPTYWLRLSHTDNQFLNSPATNSTDLHVCQSFIISPYNTADVVMGDLKTIIKYETNDHTAFADWDPQTNPITFTLQLFDYTQNQVIYTTTQNITDIITNWKNGSSEAYWRTVQIYGMKDASPGSDAIWQIKLSISDPRVYVSLNGMQRIFYNVEH